MSPNHVDQAFVTKGDGRNATSRVSRLAEAS
jgi:hypothetical protein